MSKLFVTLAFLITSTALAAAGSYFQWAQGMDGYGHCYEYAVGGGVLNNGQPVDNSLCGNMTYSWAQGVDGNGHCYEYGGGLVLNGGQPVDNSFCGG